ncbi:hypothetical protein PF005_g27209 [Phytophthora fragariae]|uniref:Uncharacterized protein n=1 Tax=Phytophthora fragariae TaxID=53985 RepID=A0A6A3VSW9_9STRA|nr:hypothetical protein PF007_g27192 [Phytophthora fragariae]KAE9171285.1 hypothetical protein PF005_g27209 [Phytophthora fragariae]
MQYLQCVSASRYVAVEVRCSSLRNDVPDDAGEGQDAIDTDASVTSGAVKGSNMGSTLHLLGIYAHGNRVFLSFDRSLIGVRQAGFNMKIGDTNGELRVAKYPKWVESAIIMRQMAP